MTFAELEEQDAIFLSESFVKVHRELQVSTKYGDRLLDGQKRHARGRHDSIIGKVSGMWLCVERAIDDRENLSFIATLRTKCKCIVDCES